MPWGRLDDQANGNAKLLALSDPAWRMWGCALIYCQANLTDGFIPQHAIESFGVRFRNKGALAEELCRSLVPSKGPMWHRVEGGFQVHDYLDWNDSREEILAERERGRQRQQSFRSRKKGNGERNALQRQLPNADETRLHVPLPQDTPTEERGSAPDSPERRQAASRSGISALIEHYVERYTAVVGQKPHVQRPKDPSILADLLRQHDEPTVSRAMDAMFASGDAFVIKQGYSIGIFKSQFNGFLLAVQKGSHGQSAIPPTAAERERIDRTLRSWGDCRHQPRCTSTAQCRALLLARFRGDESAVSA